MTPQREETGADHWQDEPPFPVVPERNFAAQRMTPLERRRLQALHDGMAALVRSGLRNPAPGGGVGGSPAPRREHTNSVRESSKG